MGLVEIVTERTPYRYLKPTHPSCDGQVHAHQYSVQIIPAGFSGGQPRGGVEEGPQELLKNGLVQQLTNLGWTVSLDEKRDSSAPTAFDHMRSNDPAVENIGNIKNAQFVSRVSRHIYEGVKAACSEGKLALTLGGDHSVAIGTIAGSAAIYPNLGVIWIDAHADINTPESTSSGNLHGCPVSFLTGLARNVPHFEWLTPCLPTSRIVYIGLRDVDGPEKKILKDNNIKAFSMHEVDRYGIGRVMEMAVEYLGGKECPIHLSFDVDGLDESVAPATGTPVRGGLTFREGHYIMEIAHQTGSLVAVDLVEVNPNLGNAQAKIETVNIGCSLVRSALGEGLLY